MRAGLTTARVVRAGADLADEVGFEHVTLSAVARGFGVQVASLYSHVRGSEDLRTGIALLALEELADRCAEELAGRAGRDALAALARAHRAYAREHPGRYAATTLRLDAETAARSAGPRHAAASRAVLRAYDLPEPDETHAVRLLGSLLRGWVELELAGAFDHSRPGPDETLPWVLDRLDALLATTRRTP